MKHYSKLMYLSVAILVVATAVSCKSDKKNSSEDKLLSIDLAESLKEKLTINFSDILSSLDYIQLDPEPNGHCTQIINVSDNYITASVRNENIVKLYDRKTGKFLGKVGDKGSGPGEYSGYHNVFISSDEKNIFIHTISANNQIKVYGINGSYQYSIPIAYNEKMNMTSFYVDNSAKRLVLAFTSFTNGDENILIVQDFEGNVIQSIKGSVSEHESGTLQRFGDRLLFHRKNNINRVDTLYQYNIEENVLDPKFVLYLSTAKKCDSYCEHSRPITYIDFGRYYCCHTSVPTVATTSTGESVLMGIRSTGYILIDKESGKSGVATIINDLGFTKEQLIAWTYDVVRNDGIIFRSYEPIGLVTQLMSLRDEMDEENDLEKIEKIDNLISNIDQEGNLVVMYGYLREN